MPRGTRGGDREDSYTLRTSRFNTRSRKRQSKTSTFGQIESRELCWKQNSKPRSWPRDSRGLR